MNKWFQVIGSILICCCIYFVGFESLQLFTQEFAFVLAAVGVIVFLVGLRVNWAVIFKKDREIYTRKELLPLAVSDLEQNYPDKVRGKLYFEGELLASVPIFILHVVESPNTPLHQRRCAFCSAYKDSPNIILSPLLTFEAHLRRLNCKSVDEIGRKYLRDSEVSPLSVWKNENKKQEEELK